ncbi:MAG: hypothetical protein K2W96_15415 [Gemmataceae bacterium]|nr:hypothetical protein [Gemmataceae bacterium]
MPPPGIPPVTVVWGGEQGARLARFVGDLLDGQFGGKMLLRDKQTTTRHRGVDIIRVPIDPATYAEFIKQMGEHSGGGPLVVLPLLFPREQAPAAFHTAMIGDGWHTGFSEEALKTRIDAWKKGASDKGEPAAASLTLSTRRPSMSALVHLLLEGQVRNKALAANVVRRSLREAGWPDDDRAVMKL